MIPRLAELEPLESMYRDFLEALPGAGFCGDIHPDLATRLVTATDNSVYQLLPQAVVYPKSTEDLVAFTRVATEPDFAAVTFAPRGGGTGTNGQSLSDGVIVDVSRHMNGILDIDILNMRVRVQPGVVLDQLNRALEPHGVFFAPSVSPSSRATIGGMISTDAAGKGSRVYGKTSQHVLALTSVLLDGSVWRSEPLDEAQLAEAKSRDDRVGALHRCVDDVVTENADAIAAQFPELQRFMTGYNLAMVRGEDGFNLNYLLAGSEGTLAFLAEAELKLTPIPAYRRLVVLKYASFEDALRSAEELVSTNPGAIETIDETVLTLARRDVIWSRVGPILGDDPNVRCVNLIEYEGADLATIQAQADALLTNERAIGAVAARDDQQAAALWTLRKKGVGLLGNAPGPRRPIAFVEDTVVPPSQLLDYVREFRAVLDEAGVSYGMFGHIDVGCLHVRPALDMTDPADERLLREISDKVVAIVQRYGGVIWGEHGKGLRSEYNPVFFGDALYGELCRIKAAFDPTNRLNPGKLAVPTGVDAALTTIDATKRGAFDRQIDTDSRAHFDRAIACNGNGACFNVDPDHVMCPSSKVTRDRVHSPKGRAGLMREWVRQLSAAGVNTAEALKTEAAPGRLSSEGFDYSHQVYQAMDGCLACKACATQCPIKVDVPQMKSEFLQLYHGRYRRPLRDKMVADLEGLLPVISRVPRLANAVSGGPIGRWVLKKLGIVDTPRLSVPSAKARLASRGLGFVQPSQLSALPDKAVLLLPDAFTTFYEAEVLVAAVDLLRALGFAPQVLEYRPSGKGMHVKGFLHRFAKHAESLASALEPAAATGRPIVGLDPAVVLVYREEIPHALGRDPGFNVQLFQEWLCTEKSLAPLPTSETFQLLAHCTERTSHTPAVSQWQAVFSALGQTLEAPAAGCCGMCGAYGHEARHREESEGIWNLSWANRIPADEAARANVLATGHSCRSQTKRFAGFRPRHPVEALAALTP